jgi:hypothetical protein
MRQVHWDWGLAMAWHLPHVTLNLAFAHLSRLELGILVVIKNTVTWTQQTLQPLFKTSWRFFLPGLLSAVQSYTRTVLQYINCGNPALVSFRVRKMCYKPTTTAPCTTTKDSKPVRNTAREDENKKSISSNNLPECYCWFHREMKTHCPLPLVGRHFSTAVPCVHPDTAQSKYNT